MATLHMLKSATDTICESFVIETDRGILVIDGGFESEAETLYAKLKELGGRVEAWFFTHPHDDHIGAFCRIMEDHGDEILVEQAYFNFLDAQLLGENERTGDSMRKYVPWMKEILIKHAIPEKTMRRGDIYRFGSETIHVLREPDPEIADINNSSVVFRLDTGSNRVLFLGDLEVEGGRQLLATVPMEELRADYVQMSHHGQEGVEKAVYQAIQPRCCLWCTPTWLWDNIGDDGYDSGIFLTVIVRGWMSELGVRKHYVNMNGPYAIKV